MYDTTTASDEDLNTVFEATTTTIYAGVISVNDNVFFELEDVSVDEITSGIHPITNYTSSVRDAINLDKGLQLHKWKRDSLGLPSALSKYFETLLEDGGYADTLFRPTNTEDLTIYTTRRIPLTGTVVKEGQYSDSNRQ